MRSTKHGEYEALHFGTVRPVLLLVLSPVLDRVLIAGCAPTMLPIRTIRPSEPPLSFRSASVKPLNLTTATSFTAGRTSDGPATSTFTLFWNISHVLLSSRHPTRGVGCALLSGHSNHLITTTPSNHP